MALETEAPISSQQVSQIRDDMVTQLPSTIGTRQFKSTKEKVIKSIEHATRIVYNWLNGLPTEEPQFDPDTATSHSMRSVNGSRQRLQREKHKKIQNKWYKAISCIRPTKADVSSEAGFEEEEEKLAQGKTRIFQVPSLPGVNRYSFGTNEVRTAKYTLLTFLPKNLYEQFHRVANFYFLLIIILQFIPAISNASSWIAMLPLTVICAATAIKDGFEDWKRHKSDNLVNYSTARVLRRAHSPVTPIEYTSATTPLPEQSWRAQLRDKLFGWKQSIFGFKPISESDHADINRWKAKYWRDIAVGDLLLINDGEAIPADILIVSTSDIDGRCFVETKNLDGETNLKIKKALPETQWVQALEDAVELQMLLETEQPSNYMHSFHGKLVIPRFDTIQPREDIAPVSLDEVLLRGCTLRNTDWVIGCAIYTGPDTKLMLNTGMTPSKRSRIERQMNPQIVLSFVLLFIICLACSIVQGQLVSSSMVNAPYWYSSFGSKVFASAWFTGFLTFWSSMVLFQTLVPISLYITVEICKTIQAYFIHEDADMYNQERGTKCNPRAWNISDDLGQIEYLFSDKTGTLTRNIMEFRQLSIAGRVYGYLPSSISNDEWLLYEGEMNDKLNNLLQKSLNGHYSFVDPQFITDISSNDAQGTRCKEALILLSLCHTVLCNYQHDGSKCDYKAQSPDEAALVGTSRDLGVAFMGRDGDNMMVSVFGEVRCYRLLEVIEFTSARKRMSVIVKDEKTGHIILYCKGADSVIMERLSAECNEQRDKISDDLERFAECGLRTLCIAKRQIDEVEYSEWVDKWRAASAALEDREMLMERESERIEQSLELLGATAIEDRLQDGVPECIETLQLAGIKIWVLTGDKLETAINIAFSCRLLAPKMVLLVVNGADEESVGTQLKEAREQQQILQVGKQEFALIIEGHSLRAALNQSLRKSFLSLACQCRAVVCCRVSPLQKAKVVELVAKSRNAMTLAIGDGANDVSMLQAADVGIGVAGEEGMQAVMASDYAVSKFSDLTRLLLLHGRWSYHRSAKVTLCSFHKNIAFVVSAFWYQWGCAFTSSYLYDYMYANFFNIMLAILPILLLGCFDQDVSETAAMSVPQLYKRGIAHSSYSIVWFLIYMANGLWQSAACYFIPRLAYGDTIVDLAGHPESRQFLGNAVGLSIIVCVNAFVLFNTKAWNVLTVIGFFLTLAALTGLMLICSVIPSMSLFGSYTQLSQPLFYAVMVLSIAVAVTPQLLFKLTQSIICPNDVDIVREVEQSGRPLSDVTELRVSDPSFSEESMETGSYLLPPPEAALTVGQTVSGTVDASQPTQPFNKKRSKSRLSRHFSAVASRIRRRMSIINLGSHRVERHTGYAFSQQDGGSGVMLRSNELREPSPAIIRPE